MKAVPQLRFGVWYDTKSVFPNDWSGDAPFQLFCGNAPGNVYCMHGDFINGWYEDALENVVVQGGGKYTDGQFIASAHASALGEVECTPTDADPGNVTSDYLESVAVIEGELSAIESIVSTQGSSTSTTSATVSATSTAQSSPPLPLCSLLAPRSLRAASGRSSESLASIRALKVRLTCQKSPDLSAHSPSTFLTEH